MNATDLDFFRTLLKTHKSEILNMTSQFKSEQSAQRDIVSDEHEAASLDFQINVSINLQEKQRGLLLQIEKALGKIENGTYDHCESCGDAISLGRLKASPFTTLCLACKEEQEDPRNFLQ